MSDPNQTYKEAFARLTSELGRPPTTRDNGWLAMHEEYKRGWAPASEPAAPQARRSPGSDAAGRHVPTEDDVRAREGNGGEALSGPGITAEGERAGTADGEGSEAGGIAERAPRWTRDDPAVKDACRRLSAELEGQEIGRVGERGPNGGVMATCGQCGRDWEREKRRGRPSLVCGECR